MAGTSLAITVLATATLGSVTLANPVQLSEDDIVDIEVTKMGTVTTSPTDAMLTFG